MSGVFLTSLFFKFKGQVFFLFDHSLQFPCNLDAKQQKKCINGLTSRNYHKKAIAYD